MLCRDPRVAGALRAQSRPRKNHRTHRPRVTPVFICLVRRQTIRPRLLPASLTLHLCCLPPVARPRIQACFSPVTSVTTSTSLPLGPRGNRRFSSPGLPATRGAARPCATTTGKPPSLSHLNGFSWSCPFCLLFYYPLATFTPGRHAPSWVLKDLPRRPTLRLHRPPLS